MRSALLLRNCSKRGLADGCADDGQRDARALWLLKSNRPEVPSAMSSTHRKPSDRSDLGGGGVGGQQDGDSGRQTDGDLFEETTGSSDRSPEVVNANLKEDKSMANWVVGYPVSDREIDLMYEDECARIWEEMNAPDQYAKQMQEASLPMFASAELIDKAEEELSAAISHLWDTPIEVDVDDLLDRLQDLRIDIQELAKHYRKGERA